MSLDPITLYVLWRLFSHRKHFRRAMIGNIPDTPILRSYAYNRALKSVNHMFKAIDGDTFASYSHKKDVSTYEGWCLDRQIREVRIGHDT